MIRGKCTIALRNRPIQEVDPRASGAVLNCTRRLAAAQRYSQSRAPTLPICVFTSPSSTANLEPEASR